jgi:hypothetical protein
MERAPNEFFLRDNLEEPGSLEFGYQSVTERREDAISVTERFEDVLNRFCCVQISSYSLETGREY